MQIDWETLKFGLCRNRRAAFYLLRSDGTGWVNSEFISSCTTKSTGTCTPMLSMSPGQPQTGVPARKASCPGAASKIQPWEDSHLPGPLLPSVGHRGSGTHCGGLLLSSDQPRRHAHGKWPWLSCRQAIPHLVSALHGAGRKMLLTQKREEWNRHEEYRHRELGPMMRTRGAQRTGTCEIVPTLSVGTSGPESQEWAGSPMPSPTSKSTEIPPDPLPEPFCSSWISERMLCSLCNAIEEILTRDSCLKEEFRCCFEKKKWSKNKGFRRMVRECLLPLGTFSANNSVFSFVNRDLLRRSYTAYVCFYCWLLTEMHTFHTQYENMKLPCCYLYTHVLPCPVGGNTFLFKSCLQLTDLWHLPNLHSISYQKDLKGLSRAQKAEANSNCLIESGWIRLGVKPGMVKVEAEESQE